MKKWKTLNIKILYWKESNPVQEEIKCRFKAGNSFNYSVEMLLSSRFLSNKSTYYTKNWGSIAIKDIRRKNSPKMMKVNLLNTLGNNGMKITCETQKEIG